MSSVTSTDVSSQEARAFRPWHFFVVLTLLAATVAVLTAEKVRPEHLVLLSVTIFAAGAAAFAFYRTLLPLVGRDRRIAEETLGHRARAALEREKLLVLRSIKELEFDRAMGKVDPEDFEEMLRRLRSRALRLMQQLDADAVAPRERIERELSERLSREAGGASRAKSEPRAARATAVADVADETAGAELVEDAAPDVLTCAACGVANDQDSRFCKACGNRLTPIAAGAGAEGEAR
jgi:hypothetical protein